MSKSWRSLLAAVSLCAAPAFADVWDTKTDNSLRVRETTVHVARFNATGSSVTNLFVQNVTERTVTATVFFWNAAGTLIAFTPITISPKGLIDRTHHDRAQRRLGRAQRQDVYLRDRDRVHVRRARGEPSVARLSRS